jgi:hypothetical protein
MINNEREKMAILDEKKEIGSWSGQDVISIEQFGVDSAKWVVFFLCLNVPKILS